MNPRIRNKLERETVTETLKVFVRGTALVINGLDGKDLNQYDYVKVTLGEMVGTFVVLSKDLISKKVQLEEAGYWASKIGKNQDKVNKCSFDNITYELITNEDEIQQIREASSWC